MSYRVSTLLLKGCKTKEDRDRYKEYLVNNKELLDRVVDVLKNKIQVSINDMRSVSSYDKPSWPQYQADQLGYQRALAEMVSILTLDQED